MYQIYLFFLKIFVFAILSSGIIYDKPLSPIQVASLRADRIAKEKKVGYRNIVDLSI